MVAATGFCNRVSTIIGATPETELENMAPKTSLWQKLSAWMPGKVQMPRIPPPDYPPPTSKVPFGNLVAARSHARRGGARGDPATAPSRLRCFRIGCSLIFSVVARTLQCGSVRTTAAQLLDAAESTGASSARCSTRSDRRRSRAVENAVIPWARDTVWMPEQPARIQERSARPRAVGPTMFIEVVGGAALANACARLAMLEI